MSTSGNVLPDEAETRALIGEALATDGSRWLASRRWYADKGRSVKAVDLVDLLIDRAAAQELAVVIAEVRFADGDAAQYFLPLVLVQHGDLGDLPTSSTMQARGWTLVDATEASWFGQWLLQRLAGHGGSPSLAWEFTTTDNASPVIEQALQAPGALMRGEQSNTSMRFGDALIVKMVRRLQPAPNPEEETLRILAAAEFASTPPYVGSGSWRAIDGTRFPILLAQAFVPNLGDGWSWTLAKLVGWHVGDGDEDQFAAERQLGVRTAEMHLALSQATDPDFVPLPAVGEGIEREIIRTESSLERTVRLLVEQEATLPDPMRQRLSDIVSGLRGLSERATGYQAESGLPRIRVHGDYHLGQTLRTTDDDWMIIDFEGEPGRPVSERRQRTSALKDVAGMLRSFSYARGASERQSGTPGAAAGWESGARAAFLAGYRQRLQGADTQLVPEAEGEFDRALQAWELDKALYEITYEARNRPDWLVIPLAALLPDLFDHSAGTAGAAPA